MTPSSDLEKKDLICAVQTQIGVNQIWTTFTGSVTITLKLLPQDN